MAIYFHCRRLEDGWIIGGVALEIDGPWHLFEKQDRSWNSHPFIKSKLCGETYRNVKPGGFRNIRVSTADPAVLNYVNDSHSRFAFNGKTLRENVLDSIDGNVTVQSVENARPVNNAVRPVDNAARPIGNITKPTDNFIVPIDNIVQQRTAENVPTSSRTVEVVHVVRTATAADNILNTNPQSEVGLIVDQLVLYKKKLIRNGLQSFNLRKERIESWLFKFENCIHRENISLDNGVHLIAFFLQHDLLKWYYMYTLKKETTWLMFKKDLIQRSNEIFADYMRKLMSSFDELKNESCSKLMADLLVDGCKTIGDQLNMSNFFKIKLKAIREQFQSMNEEDSRVMTLGQLNRGDAIHLIRHTKLDDAQFFEVLNAHADKRGQ